MKIQLYIAFATLTGALLSCGTGTDISNTRTVAQKPNSQPSKELYDKEFAALSRPDANRLVGHLDSFAGDWVTGWATDLNAQPDSAGTHYSINVDLRFRDSSGRVPPGCPERLRIPASHSRLDVKNALGLKSSAVGFDLYVPINCRSATSVTAHALSWGAPDGVFKLIDTKSNLRFNAAAPLVPPTTATLYALHHAFEFGFLSATNKANAEGIAIGVEERLFEARPEVHAPGGRAITTMPADLWTGRPYPTCFMSLTKHQICQSPNESVHANLRSQPTESLRNYFSDLLTNQAQCVYTKRPSGPVQTDRCSHLLTGNSSGVEQYSSFFLEQGPSIPEQLVRFATQQAKSLLSANIDVLLLDNTNLHSYSPTQVGFGEEVMPLIPIERFVEAMYHVHWRYQLCRQQGGNPSYIWCAAGYNFPRPPPKIAFFQSIGSDARPYLDHRLFPLVQKFKTINIGGMPPIPFFFKHGDRMPIFYVEPDESDIRDGRRPDSFAIKDLWNKDFLPIPMWTHVTANKFTNTENQTRGDFVSTCNKATKVLEGDTRLYPTSSAAIEANCILHIPNHTPLGSIAAIGPTYTVPGGMASQAYANSGFNFGLTLQRMYESARLGGANFLVIGSWNLHGAAQELILGNSFGRFDSPNTLFDDVRLSECSPQEYVGQTPLCDKVKEISYKTAGQFHTAQWRGLPVGFGMVQNLNWTRHHFLGKTYAKCSEDVLRSGRVKAARINYMFDCTRDLQFWLREKILTAGYFDRAVSARVAGAPFNETSLAGLQFAHTYDTSVSEYSPDFEPTIVKGRVRRDKFDAVAEVARRFKNNRQAYSISHAGYNVVRVATSIPQAADIPGWFVYSVEDPTRIAVPGIPPVNLREICVNHDFQTFACSDLRESRTFNGPFYLLRNADPNAFQQLYRCEKTAGGFAYVTEANPSGARACSAMGWLSKERTPQNMRVLRKCAFHANTNQEFLVVDGFCPVESAREVVVLGYIN